MTRRFYTLDVFTGQMLAGFIQIDLPESSARSQLVNDVIALRVRIRIRGVRDLKRQPS